MIGKIRVKHPELNIIIHAQLDNELKLNVVKFGLPKKATKLEKLLLKFVEIYSYDVLRNNFHDYIINSVEYEKVCKKMKQKK